MENSFFEYRDSTVVNSSSDEEFIDNSLTEDSTDVKKKNHTVFVAESEESTDDEQNTENITEEYCTPVVKRSDKATNHIISSSEDDDSSKGSIRRQSQSSNKLVLSSSDDDGEQYSPEIVPRRRQLTKKKSPDANESIIGQKRKNRKRIMLLDSDTENSIIIEQDKNRKVKCMQDTPLKIYNNKKSITDDDVKDSDEVDDEIRPEIDDKKSADKTESTVEYDVEQSMMNRTSNVHSEINDDLSDNSEEPVQDVIVESSEDDGPDEDQMVMSRATRMSIMGIIPKDNDHDSDDSDFIQSDDSEVSSKRSSQISLLDLPEVSLYASNPTEKISEEQNSSKRTSVHMPLKNITNDPKVKQNLEQRDDDSDQDVCIIVGDSDENHSGFINKKDVKNTPKCMQNYNRYDDDDVTIIDTKPEVIALSSDDEDQLTMEKSPPRKSLDAKKRSPKIKHEKVTVPESMTIKQYMTPDSYPNHEVVYVKKHIRETELMKLNALQEDLKSIRYLLDEMDIDTLPDGGAKLIERLGHLETQVRIQGDKVANMVVEPDKPTAADIARDGFNKNEGLSWDDIQKASNAVQPRMFGKQAMSTHMAERNLILDRLRDLYESLASRPAETVLGDPPRGIASKLLPHQLHALAWLRWRETQRPRAGILADDMGLGKTITMLSLIASDKERLHDDEDDEDDEHSTKTVARGGTLVVCPASLMSQWAAEVDKHCSRGALTALLHHGPARASQPHRLAAPDLVLTTYNILQRDKEKNGVLLRVWWRRVILDEAHAVRNHKSLTCGAVCALRARSRWCLTGTPVHNKDLDLFALIKFLRCSPFDDLTMWKKWIDNKSQGGQERMNTMMQCLLLRRTKVQLQQKGQLDCLPERSTHLKEVTLSKAEMNVYQKVLVFSKTLFAQFLHQRAEKNADLQGFVPVGNKDTEYAKMHKKMIALQGAKPVKSHEILVLLLRLRQVCCHCGLIAAMLDGDSAIEDQEDPAGQDLLAELNKLSLEDSSRRKSDNKQESDDEGAGPGEEGTSVSEAIRSVLSPSNPVFQLEKLSSKISAVMDCLEKHVLVHIDEKAVVVSQWTSVLRLVRVQLERRGVRCATLSGEVPVPARGPLVAALNNPRDATRVLLLSLCAGGVGLNLCGANHLLLLDPHWNPQLEEQAQDRIYRVGQKKHVHIYRFMCVDTVEQTIRKLQVVKLEMAQNVLTGAKNTNRSKLTIEDLKMLFNMGQ